MAIASALGALGPEPTPPADVRVAGATFMAVCAFVAWRLVVQPFVGTTAVGIVVRNPLRSHLIPWTDVVGLTPSVHGLIIRRQTGRTVLAIAVPKKRFVWSLGREGRAERVARELADRACPHEQ